MTAEQAFDALAGGHVADRKVRVVAVGVLGAATGIGRIDRTHKNHSARDCERADHRLQKTHVKPLSCMM